MISRLVFVFFFFALVVLAVKKTFSSEPLIIEAVPGYPAPVALHKAGPQSDAEFLDKLPSALDYAQAFETPREALHEAPHEATQVATEAIEVKSKKRDLARKKKFLQKTKRNAKLKRFAMKR